MLINCFRYCKGDGLLDQLGSLLNFKVSYVTELVTRGTAGLIWEAAPMLKDAQDNIQSQPPNYYEGCKSVVGIVQFFTDQNVNN